MPILFWVVQYLQVFALESLEEQEEQALLYSMMFLVIAVCAGGSMFLQAYLFGYSGENLTVRIRSKAFKTILKQVSSFLLTNNLLKSILYCKKKSLQVLSVYNNWTTWWIFTIFFRTLSLTCHINGSYIDATWVFLYNLL